MTTRSMLNGLRSRLPLRVRAAAVELLDAGGLPSAQLEANLADLARLNHLPGGTVDSLRAIRTLVGDGSRAAVLDVGTGRADMPVAFARAGLRATALDVNPEVLRVARREAARGSTVEVVAGDARALPFADAGFDVCHCSLLLHHLDPGDAVTALSEMARVSRRGVVINDLRRGTFPLLATVVSTWTLGRSGVTRADGLASARRAYTLTELDELLARAGLTVHWRSAAWLPRVVTAAIRA